MSSERLSALTGWVVEQLGTKNINLKPLTGDASFRGYYRLHLLDSESTVTGAHRTLIVMDAPPPREDTRPFLAVCTMFDQHKVRVPHVLASDVQQGFMILEDFGDTVLSQVLDEDNVDQLYSQAMNQLIDLQHAPALDRYPLPAYGEAKLIDEMNLFDEWFLRKFLMLIPSQEEQNMLMTSFDFLANQALRQPQVVVHRDYHCRNLMVLDQSKELGIIDFQDAVIGPITYDVVSLLRDAYVQWPASSVQDWLKIYWERQSIRGYLGKTSLAQLQQWFDWMGAQRHLKVLGIFARLYFRDGKDGYLQNLPLVFFYLLSETKGYNELSALHEWLCERVLPAFLVEVPESMDLLAEFL
ncbi:aminoglycoside phosphotransferase family protein [Aquirhabdus parva]|uniref:Phosphotransferase n=1 Tax=Aquirhabdus parva TaxID=2283318 RepID=A0A345P535_9GAMM|nr:phosphotransferase [Aquirhabdus parva]AXI02394.1 phosphotransferase [Aquirhabdus parva]